jgi:uncharacterized protein YndB with AHSA1/START domain
MSDTTSPIARLLEQIPEKTGSKAIEALDPETRAILDEFEAWLEAADGKSKATAKAYKSYVAGALLVMQDGKTWDDLTTDVRSGVNAFVRFSQAVQSGTEPAEDDGEA